MRVEESSRNHKVKIKRKVYNNLKWMSFVIPSMIFYIIFFVLPSLSGAYYSFTDWDGVNATFVGLENYKKIFQDVEILSSFKNTMFYTFFITVLQNILGLFFAVLLQKSCTRNNILRVLIFMPHIFSSLLIGYIFKFILESNIGSLNHILESVGLANLIHPWLSDPVSAKWVIVLVTVWQCMGYTMVINIAGLQGVPSDYYESASLDGASKWQQFKNITFPLIAPSTTVNIMMCLIGNLQIFNQIYSITNGGPGYETESIAITMYRLGFGSSGSGRWGYGAAMANVLFFVIMVLTVILTTVLRKREVEA